MITKSKYVSYNFSHISVYFLHLPEGFATLVMVPTALVRPSLNTSLWSQCRYSGVLMKRKWTEALSPVRKQSLFMDKMVAVCLMLPQWTER